MSNAEANVANKNIACLTAAHALVNKAWSNPTSYNEHLKKALALLQTALQTSPDDIAILTGLGAVLCDLQLHATAVEHLMYAISLGAVDWNTYFNAFVAMVSCSPFDEAHAILKRGSNLEADPATWQAYFDPHAM